MSTLAIAMALAIPSASVAAQPPVSAGWHGRPIQQPHRTDAAATMAVVAPVRMGAGFGQPGGSQRVRDLQRQLLRLGYRPGPVDGLFGARTQAAIQWFQIKHGLTPDGVAGPSTLSLLRERTAGAPAQTPVRSDRPPVAAPADRGPEPAGGDGSGGAPHGLLALVLLLLALPAALAATLLRRRRRDTPAPPAGPAARPARTNGAAPAAAVAAPPRSEPVSPQRAAAIGYVRSTRDRAELARHAGAIRRACERRGWTLEELVQDERTGGATFERPGLASALGRLSEPGPARLVVSKLGHLSSSAADLSSLFEWFDEHGVQVVATDVGLDTTTPEGRRAAHAKLAAVARRQAQAPKNGRKRGHEKASGQVAVAAAHVGANNGEAHK